MWSDRDLDETLVTTRKSLTHPAFAASKVQAKASSLRHPAMVDLAVSTCREGGAVSLRP